MEITLGMAGEIPVFSLRGRLDSVTSPLLEERLKPLLESPSASRHLVFEGESLSYVSSAGLRVFLMAHRELTAGGGGLAFAGLSQHARDLFQLAGLQDLFVIEDSVDKAARRLS